MAMVCGMRPISHPVAEASSCQIGFPKVMISSLPTFASFPMDSSNYSFADQRFVLPFPTNSSVISHVRKNHFSLIARYHTSPTSHNGTIHEKRIGGWASFLNHAASASVAANARSNSEQHEACPGRQLTSNQRLQQASSYSKIQ